MYGSLFCPRPRPRLTFRPPHRPPASPPPPHPLIVRPPPRRRSFRRRLLRSGAAALPGFSCEYSFARRRAVFAAPRRAFSILRSFLLIGLNLFLKTCCACQNHTFGKAHPICRKAYARGEAAAFLYGVPLKYAEKRENRPPERHRREAAGFLSKSRKKVLTA